MAPHRGQTTASSSVLNVRPSTSPYCLWSVFDATLFCPHSNLNMLRTCTSAEAGSPCRHHLVVRVVLEVVLLPDPAPQVLVQRHEGRQGDLQRWGHLHPKPVCQRRPQLQACAQTLSHEGASEAACSLLDRAVLSAIPSCSCERAGHLRCTGKSARCSCKLGDAAVSLARVSLAARATIADDVGDAETVQNSWHYGEPVSVPLLSCSEYSALS